MNTFLNFFQLLSSSQKKGFFILFFLSFFTIGLEVLSIGSIVPLVLFFLGEQLSNVKFFIPFDSNIFATFSEDEIIKYIFIFIFASFIIKNLILVYVVFLESRISWNIEYFFRKELFKKFLNESLDYHSLTASSYKINLVYKECSYIFHGVLHFISLVTEAIFTSAICFLIIFYYPKIFAILSLSIFGTMILYHLFTKKILTRLSKERQEGDQHLINRIQNGINGIREMKIYNTEKKYLEDFTKNTFKLFNISRLLQALVRIPKIILEVAIILALFLAIVIFLYSGNETQNTLALLSLLVISAVRVMPSFLKLYNSYQSLKISKPSIELITKELITIKDFKNNKNNDKDDLSIKFETIELKDVSYSIKETDRTLFKNVNLKINKNEIIGIKGESGIGKSTLIDVISGFKKPSKGNIFVEKINIHNFPKSWQKNISYVPQEIFLLDDTIYMNICFEEKSKIDLKKLEDCCNKAEIIKLINELPDGFDTKIGEGGSRLSQGQRQRLGLARALYHTPEVLIMDESTNALDLKTEEKVLKILKKLSDSITIIIISHSNKPLSYCDRVFEIKNQEIRITENLK